MCNPSLWTGKDWQCYNKSFPAADERMCRNKKLGNRKRDFSNFPNLFFLDPPPLSSAMVSICLMPLPPGHPPSDLRDPPFPLRTFKFKHKHFLSCNFNEHRCFVLSWLYIATPSLHILFLFNIFLVVLNPFVKQNCNLNPPLSAMVSFWVTPPSLPSPAKVSIWQTAHPPFVSNRQYLSYPLPSGGWSNMRTAPIWCSLPKGLFLFCANM